MTTGTLIKRADPNDGNDAPFEQAFSNLAHAYLADRAPGLLDFEVGFQLVDRNDDNNKAVGVLGFKAGSNWLYGPVFFINGDLKGHELLYVKNQDNFVPLKENWIDYLLAKKPVSLGEGVNRNTKQLGVHYPDMFRALQSPHKYASVSQEEADELAAEAAPLREKLASVATGGFVRGMKDWAVVAVAAMAKHAAEAAAYEPKLLDVLKSGGVPAVEAIYRTFEAFPRLKAAFETLYPQDAVVATLEHIRRHPGGDPRTVKQAVAGRFRGSVIDRLNSDVRRKVEVHEFQGFGKAASVLLSEDDKAILVREGLLIKDAREDDEVSKAYAVPVRIEGEKKFTTPSDSGVYQVLSKTGELIKCLVVVGPLGGAGAASFATVIQLTDGRKPWANVHQSYVWVDKQFKGWSDWYMDLPNAKSLSKDGGLYVVLGPDGNGTLPFRVEQDLGGDAAGGEAYEVNFDESAQRSRAAGDAGVRPYSYPQDEDVAYSRYRDGARIHLNQKTGTKFRVNRGDVYVPEGYKLVKLEPDEAEKAKEKDYFRPYTSGRSSDPPLPLGDAIDVEANITRKLAGLELLRDAHQVGIRTERPFSQVQRLSEKQALVHLVAGLGLRQEVAQELLEKSAAAYRKGHGASHWLLKLADGYGAYGGQPGGKGAPYMTDGGPYAPDLIDPMQGYDDVMGSAVPAQHPMEESLRVTDMKADPRNRDAYDPVNPDPLMAQVAQDAADKGQKEVFDTAMIGSLLKATRDDSMVDKYIGPMMKCLDALGRMLFVFYWRGEEFAERYGDSEMPELEDSLRSNFEDLGDLTLKLKQRGVEAPPDESSQAIDLSESGSG